MFQHYSKGRTPIPHASTLNPTLQYACKCSVSRYKYLPEGKLVGNIDIIQVSRSLTGLKIINITGVTGPEMLCSAFCSMSASVTDRRQH